MMLLGVGIAIIGMTTYAILSASAPPQPVHEEIAPPQNNTPFVGKQW